MHPSSPLSARALTEQYGQGTANPVDVAEQCLALASQTPSCFITLTADRAMAEATAARRRYQAGTPLSALDGVPITWKDLFDVQGTPTTQGAEIYRHAEPATQDAELVARAASAGLVSLGKTNLTEFAYSGLGLNPHWGTPTNPKLPGEKRAPGGSSSGAAIAVAVGISPFGMATDTAGSARIPAAFNGLVGYRSSGDTLSKNGMKPLAKTLDAAGIIAKTADDVRLLVSLLCRSPLPLDNNPGIADLHFVFDESILDDRAVTASVREDILRAIDRLRAAGAKVTAKRVRIFADALNLLDQYGWLGAAEAFALHRELLSTPLADKLDQRVRERLMNGSALTAETVTLLRQGRRSLMAAAQEEVDGAILLTPTVAHPAPPLAELEADAGLFAAINLATLRLTMPASFLDLASITLPVRSSRFGDWTGLHLSMPTGHDAALLNAAARIENKLR